MPRLFFAPSAIISELNGIEKETAKLRYGRSRGLCTLHTHTTAQTIMSQKCSTIFIYTLQEFETALGNATNYTRNFLQNSFCAASLSRFGHAAN